MKAFLSSFLFCFITACGGVAHIDYTPDLSNVKDPIYIIKSTLEEQPPTYANLPEQVEVTDRRITLYIEESRSNFPSVSSGGSVVSKNYYFKDLGAPKLSNSPVWNVAINDNSGYYLYSVYVNTEKEAKEFINALVYMTKKSQ